MVKREPSAEIIAKYSQLKKDLAEYEMHESNPDNINYPQGLMSKEDIQKEISDLKNQYSTFSFADGL